MLDIILVVLAVMVGFWLLISAAGFVPSLLILWADFQIVRDPRFEESVLKQAMQRLGEAWLNDNGFEPEAVIRPLGIVMALFGNARHHAGLAVYSVADKFVVDMVTVFPNDVGITTANTIDGVAAPLSPGSIMQCLPSSSHEERWQAHLEAVAVIRAAVQAQEIPLGLINQEMARSVRRQVGNEIRHPWLILSIPYRYFVTRLLHRNVTVAEQIRRGWLDLDRLAQQVRS
jgi:hypothetical protein